MRRTPWVLALGAVAVLLAALAGAPFLGERALRSAVDRELAARRAPADLVEFYEARGDQPLWVEGPSLWPLRLRPALRAEARQMAALAPAVGPLVATAQTGGEAALARADVSLSLALADYAHNLRRPAHGVRLAFVDPDLAAVTERRAVLDAAAAAPSLTRHLAGLGEINPVYQALRQGLATYRAQWSRLPRVQVPDGPALALGATGERVRQLRTRLGLAGAGAFDESVEAAVRRFQAAHGLDETGEADAATLQALNAGAGHYEQLILANLERARLLPPATGGRFVLVNTAAAQLQVYDDGALQDSMRVIVGTPQDPTPMMAGLIRYLVVNPSWYVPVDLVRRSVAPKVLRSGPGYLQAAHLQALSDFSDQATPIAPQQVDWQAVAAGQEEARVRQTPGGDNMMGQVKFMLPNELGIYLHDTPEKWAFQAERRLMSAGCVRVERASDLAAWLLGGERPNPKALSPDHRIDLEAPAPVYITYLTAAPTAHGVAFYPDVYQQDSKLLVALDADARRTQMARAAKPPARRRAVA